MIVKGIYNNVCIGEFVTGFVRNYILRMNQLNASAMRMMVMVMRMMTMMRMMVMMMRNAGW